MRKRVGVLIVVTIISLIFFASFIFAASNESSNETASTTDTTITTPIVKPTTTTTSTNKTTTASSTTKPILSKLDSGYYCLESKVQGKCTSFPPIEIALTILAIPSEKVITECKAGLLGKECVPYGDCKIKDTALSILALNSIGQNTELQERWLTSKETSPDNIDWLIQIIGTEQLSCTVSYGNEEYPINIAANGRIDSAAGSCLNLDETNLFLQVDPECYGSEFSISCDKDFKSGLLFREKASNIFSPVSGTQSSPGFGTLSLTVDAKCFGNPSCNYEDNLWAVLALLKTGKSVDKYLPYLNSLSDLNDKYLPYAFLYMISADPGNADILIEKKDAVEDFWNLGGDSFYDTGLALVALKDSGSDELEKAKEWALFTQSKEGCWRNSVLDTAMIIWGLTDRTPPKISSSTYCEESGFFCSPQIDCPESDQLANFYCAGVGDSCCIKNYLKTCTEYGGIACNDIEQDCSGTKRKASDASVCCIGTCVQKQSECNITGGQCKSFCLDTEDVLTAGCFGDKYCCKEKEFQMPWGTIFWVLFFLILIGGGAILYIKREVVKPYLDPYINKIKPFWTNLKLKLTTTKKQELRVSTGIHERPGFPPMRRRIEAPAQRNVVRDRRLEEVFDKLRKMTK